MAIGGGGGAGGKAKSIRDGRAVVEASLDDAGFRGQLAKLKRQVLGFGKSVAVGGAALAGLGASIVAPLTAAFREALDHAAQFKDLADSTGASAESLSKLGFAAEQSGGSLEDVANGIKFLQKAMVAAADGSESFADAFKQLGTSAEELKGKSAEEQFAILAEGLEAIEDPARRTVLAMKVLGRGGKDLQRMLKGGSAGLAQTLELAKRVGAEVTGKEAEDAEAIGDSIDAAWTSVKNTIREVGKAFFGSAEEIHQFAALVIQITGGLREFIRENRQTIVIVGLVAAGLLAAGTAAVALGAAIAGLGFVLGGISAALAAWPILLGVVIAVAAVLAGIALFPEDAAASWRMFSKLLEDFFGGLAETMGATFQGIKDALAMGDMKAAWSIALKGLEALWRIFTNNLEKIWLKFRSSLESDWIDLKARAKGLSPYADDTAIENERAAAQQKNAERTAEAIRRLERKNRSIKANVQGAADRIAREREVKDNTDLFAELMNDLAKGTRGRVAAPAAAGMAAAPGATASAQTHSMRNLSAALGLGAGVRESEETKELKKANTHLEAIEDEIGELGGVAIT